MISMDQYRIFYFAAKLGNISKAAEVLFVSQPAISKSIKNLEEQSKCKLFIRSSKGVRLTSEGEILYNHIKTTFENLLSGERLLQRLVLREEGVVKIGISNTLCKFFLLPYIKSFHDKYPKIKIQVVNRSSTDTLVLMDEGLVDFVITSSAIQSDLYTVIDLVSIQDIFVTAKKSDSLNGEIPIEKLKQYPIMMLEKKNITREYIDTFLNKQQIVLIPEIEISSMEFLIEFAKIGLGIATVIKEFVLEDLKKELLYEINVTPAIPHRNIGIIYKNQIPIANAAKAFIEHLKELVHSRETYLEEKESNYGASETRIEIELETSIEIMKNRIVDILYSNKPSIYLYGSLVLDDFKPGCRDIEKSDRNAQATVQI